MSPIELRQECEKLMQINRAFQKEVKELRKGKDPEQRTQELQTELQHAKEALSGTVLK